ncbi:MAG: hypothetical protein DWQ18_03275 [Crenarchaeota archaeon]|nr:MAG: hypothetical protein DWQ17_05250 [Thermoproteota archaeon]RDJ34336.1 MAG: hypothetical protein DWQ18_03275 [Thermoproteota archaeon]RDJ37200.1 MAG: hypothetical protein DWQ13_07340 [Thermoproteota archaeon]RDJ37920.1 MAG: hypothetical protein DWQ19_03495 [Thermoproteota archaeon]
MEESKSNLQLVCDKLLKSRSIRFAGFLDYMGNLVAGGFRKDVEPLKDDAERKKMFIEAVLRVRTRQDFDENLGPVSYAAARRKNVVTMTLPFKKHVLFLSLEEDINIDQMGQKIVQACNESQS